MYGMWGECASFRAKCKAEDNLWVNLVQEYNYCYWKLPNLYNDGNPHGEVSSLREGGFPLPKWNPDDIFKNVLANSQQRQWSGINSGAGELHSAISTMKINSTKNEIVMQAHDESMIRMHNILNLAGRPHQSCENTFMFNLLWALPIRDTITQGAQADAKHSCCHCTTGNVGKTNGVCHKMWVELCPLWTKYSRSVMYPVVPAENYTHMP